MIGHALRVEDAVEMIAFMLHDPGMKTRRLALDHRAVEPERAIADPQMARHDAAQPGNRQAALPPEGALVTDRLDDRVDQRGQTLFAVTGQVRQPLRPDK